MNIEAVIGANYGDEGKGLFTEYLCRSRPSPLVVLSNGGSQRGHTVNNAEKGIRHVFHHFGSGTLLGVPSIYSKTFLLNPITYIEEKRELENVGIKPTAFRAPSCLLQLPSDMFTNQMLEKARGQSKHGSCGWGIWETVVRNNQHRKMSFETFASLDYQMKRKTLLEEVDWQLSCRLNDCKDSIDTSILKCIMSEPFIKHFIQDFEKMADDVKVLDDNDLLDVDWGIFWPRDVETLIVENGQGLLLDKNYAPADEDGKTDIHATPSKCGIEGAIEAVGDIINAESITANYVTRTYFTRHGEGPFPEQSAGIKFEDLTNIENEYQGSIKFGRMTNVHVMQLLERIEKDFSSARFDSIKNERLAVTHCNEEELCEILAANADFMSYDDNSSRIRIV